MEYFIYDKNKSKETFDTILNLLLPNKKEEGQNTMSSSTNKYSYIEQFNFNSISEAASETQNESPMYNNLIDNNKYREEINIYHENEFFSFS